MPSILSAIPPATLGMPPHITGWRSVQERAIDHVLQDPTPYTFLAAPVGMGKSAIAMAAAKLEDSRAVYLTFTKALQQQLLDDFSASGLSLIKGRNNFPCTHHQGTCEDHALWCSAQRCSVGHKKCEPTACSVWSGSCPYRQQLQDAHCSKLVVANYAYWISAGFHSGCPVGPTDLLICDEAHAIPETLCDMLSVTVYGREVHKLGMGLPTTLEDLRSWQEWAAAGVARLEVANNEEDTRMRRAEYESESQYLKRRSERKRLADKLGRIESASGEWAIEDDSPRSWRLIPVYAYQHTMRLFQGIEKVILMSGTMTRRTAALLGLSKDSYTWHDYPYAFPKQRAPLYFFPTVRIRKDTLPADMAVVFEVAAHIIRTRSDRHGIIHTVSYRRAQEFCEWLQSNHPDLMKLVYTHSYRDTESTVSRFKRASGGAVLVSPSVTTGYDFPGNECEYIIWLKCPFPNMTTPVMRAREQADNRYGGYLMCQDLMQGVGRGMRSATDRCETFILDSTFSWVRSRFRSFLATWFRPRELEKIPDPPPKWTTSGTGGKSDE